MPLLAKLAFGVYIKILFMNLHLTVTIPNIDLFAETAL